MGQKETEPGNILCTFWYPEGVKERVAFSGDFFIGKVDESTVLKFPCGEEGDDMAPWLRREYERILEGLQVERKIYERIGKHPRIIEFKGWQDSGPGLLLEFAPNGDLAHFLHDQSEHLSVKHRLRIARETAEGIDFVHTKNVLVRDVATRNILLDAGKHVKLCDLTGVLLGDDGSVIAAGQGWEDSDATKPRPDTQHADRSTDLFALGTAIFNIMTGQCPFPDTDDDQEIKQLFEQRKYPELDERLGGKVVWGCWDSLYESAGEVPNEQ
ncbi:kinase-like domain-containing protein [Phyllosticta citricarpa]